MASNSSPKRLPQLDLRITIYICTNTAPTSAAHNCDAYSFLLCGSINNHLLSILTCVYTLTALYTTLIHTACTSIRLLNNAARTVQSMSCKRNRGDSRWVLSLAETKRRRCFKTNAQTIYIYRAFVYTYSLAFPIANLNG